MLSIALTSINHFHLNFINIINYTWTILKQRTIKFILQNIFLIFYLLVIVIRYKFAFALYNNKKKLNLNYSSQMYAADKSQFWLLMPFWILLEIIPHSRLSFCASSFHLGYTKSSSQTLVHFLVFVSVFCLRVPTHAMPPCSVLLLISLQAVTNLTKCCGKNNKIIMNQFNLLLMGLQSFFKYSILSAVLQKLFCTCFLTVKRLNNTALKKIKKLKQLNYFKSKIHWKNNFLDYWFWIIAETLEMWRN